MFAEKPLYEPKLVDRLNKRYREFETQELIRQLQARKECEKTSQRHVDKDHKAKPKAAVGY